MKSGATTKEVIDYKLSRYAGYLKVQNASPVRHKSVAEHIYGCLILAIGFESEYNLNVDLLKVY